jgi:hypothetical protein
MNAILNEASAEKISAERISDRVLKDRQFLDWVFQVISNGPPSTKFRCSKALLLLSESNPNVLYSRIQDIVNLLESKNQILKWNAIAILGNMASEDCKSVIDGILPKMYAFLACGELITANHAIAALGKIGRVFPEKKKKIIAQLLKVEDYAFDTGECRSIAVGKVILALEDLIDFSQADEKAAEFARRYIDNRRPATAKKAKEFLRRLA